MAVSSLAQTYYPASGNPALGKTANETFPSNTEMAKNWSAANTGASGFFMNDADNTRYGYVRPLASTGASAVIYQMRITDATSNNCYVGGYGDNNGTTANVASIRQSGTTGDFLLREEAAFATTDIVEGLHADGTWQEIKVTADHTTFEVNVSINKTQVATVTSDRVADWWAFPRDLISSEVSCGFEVRNWVAINDTSYDVPGLGAPEFGITLKDLYDGDLLQNFTVTIFNSTDSFTNTTTSGSITYDDITSGLYDLNFTGIMNSTYFNRTYREVNVSSDFTGEAFQSVINLIVNDTLSSQLIPSFTVETNVSVLNGTDGNLLILTKAGTHQILNVSESQYPKQEYIFNIGILENKTFYANMSPQFNFYLRREADNTEFDIDGTNNTKLTIYCPEKNIILNFKNSSIATTTQNTTLDCQYTLMKMDVSYTDSSYFRTLIPPTSQKNVTWWLLDLNQDTGVQKILELVDLTGDWSSGTLRLTTGIDQNNEDIIEQQFDVSTAATLYLLKDALYTVHLINNEGTEERQLGTLIADTAGTVTITYPNLEFYPESTTLENNISWSYTCPFTQCPPPQNTSDNILRLQYLDETGQTSAITWKVYNGTNQSHLLQEFTSSLSDVTFTYSPVTANNTYFTTLLVEHNTLGINITDSRVFGSLEEPLSDLEGWSEEDAARLKFFGSGIFLFAWGLLFSAFHAGIGMVTTFIWAWVLKSKGFFPISYAWLAMIGFAAIVGFIYEAMKRD